MTALILDFDAPLPNRLYWDASFLIHAVYPGGRYHQQCYAFLERLNSAVKSCSFVSSLALDEVIFTLIRLKLTEEHPDQGFWKVYRETPEAIQPYLGEIRALVKRLFNDSRIQVVGTVPESILIALRYMSDYSLLPRDALHLSTMAHYGIKDIVTTDDDFIIMPDLNLYTCNPKILG